jgi:hypothetical protein
MVVSPWSPRSADVSTIRCPRPGAPQGGRRWAGPERGLSRHGNEPGRPRRLGFHGTLSARLWSGSGDGSSPNEDDLAATTSGLDLTVEGCGEPHPGRWTVDPRLDSMVRTAGEVRTRWPLTCGSRYPAEDPGSGGCARGRRPSRSSCLGCRAAGWRTRSRGGRGRSPRRMGGCQAAGRFALALAGASQHAQPDN